VQEPENIAVLWLETLEKMELIRSMVVHSLWNYSGLRQFVSGNGIPGRNPIQDPGLKTEFGKINL